METAQEIWRIELFGGLRACKGDRVIDRFQTRQTASLLAYLAAFPRRHLREELVDLLWPDADPESGRNRLSQALSWLKAHFGTAGEAGGGSLLLTDRNGVALETRVIVSDVVEFERGIERAADDESLAQALALYRETGFLPGFYDDWVLRERERLLTLFLIALNRLMRRREQTGDLNGALALAQRALAADPLEEEAHCHVIRLQIAAGLPAAALRQYRDLTRLLAEELGAEPSPSTRALLEQMKVVPLEAVPAPAVRQAVSPVSLPLPLTRFFGREALLEDVGRLIQNQDARLLTLTGTGGTGKTRLALEVAHHVQHTGRLVIFAPLADLNDPRLVPETVAEALGDRRNGAVTVERIASALLSMEQQTDFAPLLILDNAEHLIDGVSSLVRELLQRVPTLIILVTSRRRLGVEGERELPVPPLPILPLPDSAPAEMTPELLLEAPSVLLFLDRARAVRPDFPQTPESLSAVTRLCARLEGLPLAIELCAAWAQTLTPDQMLPLLDHRFDLLVSRRSDIPARHRTLRAALEYSFIQLPSHLKSLFIRLSVFRGGWTLAAAQAVCGLESLPQSAALLAGLQEYSLIVAEEAQTEAVGVSEMRYRMLESLREFADGMWTMATHVTFRQAHADYYLSLAEEAGAHLSGHHQALWLHRIDDDLDNLRAALTWLIERQELERGLRLAVALARYWNTRGYLREARQWLERLIPLLPTSARIDRRLRAQALNAYAKTLESLTDFTGAEAYAREALTAWRELEDASGTADSLVMLGTIAMMHEDYGAAVELLEEARSLARGVGDEEMTAGAVYSLGRIAIAQENWPEASDAMAECLRLWRLLGDRTRAASALNNLGLVARYRGDLKAARDLMHQALSENQALDDRPRMAVVLLNIGTVDRLDHRYGDSLAMLRRAMTLALEIANRRVQAWCVKELGHLACAVGQFELSLRLLSLSESLRTSLNMSFNPFGPAEIAHDRAVGQEALGASRADEAWASGAALIPEQAFSDAVHTLLQLDSEKLFSDLFSI
jgi:predicted ATPase/DNA-binding SARP family transcriptional activator